ncbi:MAG: ChaN family lipoprotein [Polyangiales bacterium]
MTMSWRLCWLFSLFTCLLACTPVRTAKNVEPLARFGDPFTSKLGSDHPLVGRIYDVHADAFVREEALVARVRAGQFVLLGEKHDNPDHHRLQALLLGAMIESGRHPSVAFEMLDFDAQDTINHALAESPRNPDAVARAVSWEKTGWPPFAEYRPIVARALDAHLSIVAANYPTKAIKALFSPLPPALEHETAVRFGIDLELPEASQQSLSEELRASHCGGMPESFLPKMVLAQRLRDGAMAERLIDSDHGDGAVLIAGAGHARLDRGVPMVLRRKGAKGPIVAVAFAEVATSMTASKDYAAGFHASTLPFDYVVFTPRIDDADPCVAFKHGAHPKL